MKASEINNNPLTKAWEKRFSQLTVEKQQRILELEKKTVSEYQLNVIKRTRSYPEVGDIFDINPKDDVIYQGLVINNHIDNLYGKDLIIVIIFNNNEDIREKMKRKISGNDLLLPPCLIGKEYWTRGFFHTIRHMELKIDIESYGFYRLGDGLYYNEYDKKLEKKNELISMGGYTISGIAYEMNQEMIIRE